MPFFSSNFELNEAAAKVYYYNLLLKYLHLEEAKLNPLFGGRSFSNNCLKFISLDDVALYVGLLGRDQD